MQEKVWNDVKTLIASAPVLAYYKPTEVLEIQCDSSQSGLGAALMQNGYPIAYASRALTETVARNVDPFAKVRFGGTVREGKQNVLSGHSL